MSKLRRISSFLAGILMLVCALILMFAPEIGYPMVVLILSFSLLVFGIKSFLYYFTMARHMVGGKASLYTGIILFDMGMFTVMLANIPPVYIIIYLAAVKLFAGGIDILSAIDSKHSGSPSWKMKLAAGIVNILIAAACVIFGQNQTIIVYIYGSGLIYSAVRRLISAFRKTAIVYIN